MKRTINAVTAPAFLALVLLIPHTITAEEIDQEYCALAQSCKEEKKVDKATKYYKRALSLNPKNFDAAFELAGIFFQQDNMDQAVFYYAQALALRPQNAQIHYNLGLCHSKNKETNTALEHFRQATTAKSDYTKAYIHQAKILQQQKQSEEAIVAYTKVADLDPFNFEAHYELGRLYRERNEFDEAVSHFRTALNLNEYHVGAVLELANTLSMLENTNEECLVLYKRALELKPKSILPLYNCGYTLKKMGYIQEAIKIYDKVIEQEPDYALARFGRAVSYLALADFERGWPEYEWRWPAYNGRPERYKNKPIWDGFDIKNKRMLIYCEQGLGDTLQFIRYAKMVKERGAYVIVQCQNPLKAVLSLCPYIDCVVNTKEPLPPFDTYVPSMSLPLRFKTDMHTIPNEIPYLYASPELVTYWHDQLAQDKNFKIGICWQGNPNYSTQALRQAVAAKSMKASHFKPIAQLEGVSLYSLQKTTGEDQLEDNDGFMIRTFGADFDESHGRFMDTAAVIKNLDLVITIDTSICHIAGGLGVPVWNVLPNPADWRWFHPSVATMESSTPWYPNMRLFRQPTPGDWESVVATIVQELSKIIGRG